MNILFLICPTDFLETTINSRFKGDKYFYSSLGNSFQLSDDLFVGQIKEFLLDKSINRIMLVLKDSYTFFSGKLNESDANGIACIKELQTDIYKCKTEIAKFSGDLITQKKLAISKYLNRKALSLKISLNRKQIDIEVKALVYNKNNQTFSKTFDILITNPSFFKLNSKVLILKKSIK